MVLDPGHFHAALMQKETLPGVSEMVHVFAPLGTDLTAHLNRVSGFNHRAERPTHWLHRIYAGPDFLDRMIAEHPGNVVILSGRNQGKIVAIQRALTSGINVLGDKPWVIEPEDLAKLELALKTSGIKKVAAYDAMTQRYEISCILQRELVNDEAVFGKPMQGTKDKPAVTMESVHYLLKLVAGVPNLRPAWFFDVRQQGEGLTDVGTHLVDLVQWILFPDQTIRHRTDVNVLAGAHWPTVISPVEFRRVTGEAAFPAYLQGAIRNGNLDYFCNNSVDYTVKGIHTRLVIKWDFEAPPGMGDTELAIFEGSLSRVEVRQGAEEKYRPEVYVVPKDPASLDAVRRALEHKLQGLAGAYPGLGVKDLGGRLQVTIPDRYRIGHEAHFALLCKQFLQYVHTPSAMPAWEEPGMITKYYVTTRGVELARQSTQTAAKAAAAH